MLQPILNTLSISERTNVKVFVPLVVIYGVEFAAIISFGLLWLTYKQVPLHIIGIIGGVVPLLTFAVGNFAGSIGDYTGNRRRVLAVIFGVCIAMVPIIHTVPSGWVLYIAGTVFLVGANVQLPLFDGILTQLFPLQENRSFSFLWIRGLLTLGFLIGTLWVGKFYDVYGLVALPWVGLALLVCTLVLIMGFDDSTIPKHGRDMPQDTLWHTVKDLLQVAWFKAFLLYNILYGVGNAFYFGFFPIHLQTIGFSNMHIALTISLGALTEVIMFFIGHTFVNRYRPTQMMIVCAVVAPVRWVLFSQFTDVGALTLVASLHMITFSLHWVVCGSFIQKNVPISLVSTAQNAWQSCCMFIPMAVVLPISGVIYPIIGGNMFLIGAGVSFASVFVAVYMWAKR